MSEFTRRNSKSESVPAILASQVIGFKESPEYKEMRDYELKIPGVVCSCFAKYLQRLHDKQFKGHERESTERAILSAHEALNLLASSHETDALVTDEIFESFDCSQETLNRIRHNMGLKARSVFDEWRNKQDSNLT